MKRKKLWKVLIILMTAVLCWNSAEPACVRASTAKQVLKGKKGWLFYQNESDGCNIPEYRGNNHYSKAAMKNIRKNLLKMKKAVKTVFVVCIVPNKEVMYPKYMPDNIKRKSKVTRADQLVKYLKKSTKLKIVYPKQELMAAKKNHQVYYKTDTHWNGKGRFIGVQALRKEILGTEKSIDDVRFKITTKKYSGDLARLLGQSSRYRTDTKYTPILKIKKKEKSKKDILIVGDSFGHEMAGQADKYFGKVSYSGIWEFKMSQIRKGTDVVVWEGAERYLDRFSSVKLYNR